MTNSRIEKRIKSGVVRNVRWEDISKYYNLGTDTSKERTFIVPASEADRYIYDPDRIAMDVSMENDTVIPYFNQFNKMGYDVDTGSVVGEFKPNRFGKRGKWIVKNTQPSESYTPEELKQDSGIFDKIINNFSSLFSSEASSIPKAPHLSSGYSLDTLLKIKVINSIGLTVPSKASPLQIEEIYNSLFFNPDEKETISYTVKAGDGLWKIATNHGMTLLQLRDMNPLLGGKDLIHPNLILNVKNPNFELNLAKLRSLSDVYEKEEIANKDNLSAILAGVHTGNYVVIDKDNLIVKVYDKNNKLLYTSKGQIASGLSGDDYNTMTRIENGKLVNFGGNNSTPAGITYVSGTGTYHGHPSYTRERVNRDGSRENISSSMHYWSDIDSPYASNGCIRMSGQLLSDLTNKGLLQQGTPIYTLPSKGGSHFETHEGVVNYVADNPYGNEQNYYDDYNVSIDKSYRPLIVLSKGENSYTHHWFSGDLSKEYKLSETDFANALSLYKLLLMKEFGVSSTVYNLLAQLSMGLAQQESGFGTGAKYKVKLAIPGVVKAGHFLRGDSDLAPSRGFTQIKLENDLKNKDLLPIYQKYNITSESLLNPEISALATMIRLLFTYKNEYLGRDFRDADGNKLGMAESLLYLWNGRGKHLRSGKSKPWDNLYIQTVLKYSKGYNYYGVYKYGGKLNYLNYTK